MRTHHRPCGSGAIVALAWLVAAHAVAAPATQPAHPIDKFAAKDLPLNLNGANGELAEWLKPFDRPVEQFEYTVQLVREEEKLRFFRIVFPSPVKTEWPNNDVIIGELYLPKVVKDQTAAAIVLDIMDGSAIIPRGMARGLAERGAVALYFPMACYGSRRPADDAHLKAFMLKPSLSVDNMRQTVSDIRRAKAILASRPEVDAGRIGLMGVSLGGIMTSLAAGVDGEFARVVPILAGGDITAITYHARETRRIREAIEQNGMTRQDTEKLLAPVEPLHFAGRIAARTCLMINAARDEVIPKETTEALQRAIGAQILWTPLGHYSSMLYLPNIRQKAIDFILGMEVKDLEMRF